MCDREALDLLIEEFDLQPHKRYLEGIRQGDYGFTDELEACSVEELEETIEGISYEESKVVSGEDKREEEVYRQLFDLILNCRKRKLDAQFDYNQQNIDKIIHIDTQLKQCCAQLKEKVKAAEKWCFRMVESKDDHEFCRISASIFIDASTTTQDNKIVLGDLGYPLSERFGYVSGFWSPGIDMPLNKESIETIKQMPIFDVITNHAEKFDSNIRFKTSEHISHALYLLHQVYYFSLSDIMEIHRFHGGLTLDFGGDYRIENT